MYVRYWTPPHVSGNSMTTVDYIIASLDATSIISSCKTLPMTDLNMSDHLPLVAELTIEYQVQTPPNTHTNLHSWLDGSKQLNQERSMNTVGL